MTHDLVSDAAVIGIPDEEAGEVPMAFIVAAGAPAPTLEELQEHLGRSLATYKRIQRVELVGEIPKSASGKILRRVLRESI